MSGCRSIDHASASASRTKDAHRDGRGSTRTPSVTFMAPPPRSPSPEPPSPTGLSSRRLQGRLAEEEQVGVLDGGFDQVRAGGSCTDVSVLAVAGAPGEDAGAGFREPGAAL